MANYRTPGAYIEEISKLPASVAPVATAIPAFIGYTEMREQGGATLAANTPVRITSMLEYEEIFGGAFDEELTVTLADLVVGTETVTDISVTTTNADRSPYILYYNMLMYFANGGGPCYVVSVGDTYANPISAPTTGDIVYDDLKAGLDAVEKEDEVTLLVVPEAVILGDATRKTMNDDMVTQCNKLQDRFAILDARSLDGVTVFNDGVAFRADIGIDYLKYGAAYYPSLLTMINMNYENGDVEIVDNRDRNLFDTLTLENINSGSSTTPISAEGTITIDDFSILSGDSVTIDSQVFVESATPDPLVFEWSAGASEVGAASNLAAAINSYLATLGSPPYTIERLAGSDLITITATAGSTGNSIALAYSDSGTGSGISLSGATLEGGADETLPYKTLYNDIVDEIKNTFDVTLYPSAAMAGVYARVDNDRGVWKAPANVSVSMVKEPTKLVTHAQQENMNVDATSGKSINVIRKFSGKGIIVWGARTLAGNDNEWRYVPVRRLYNFVEESVKKATEFVVFEPNDANTWLRTKTMIENFLTNLWRDGALAGAKPEQAFFVNVGLGETMTSLDILEGRMIIEIGMAAVRPAEFIILKFSHKLQES